MMGADTAFYWVGLTVVVLATLTVIGGALVWFYANIIHGRFEGAFGKSKSELSLARWHNTWLSRKGRSVPQPADAWPIRKPFYLAYRVGETRLLLMFALVGEDTVLVRKDKK